MAAVVKINFSGPVGSGRMELLSAVYRALYDYSSVSALTRSGELELSVILKRISVPPLLPEVKKGEEDD